MRLQKVIDGKEFKPSITVKDVQADRAVCFAF